MVEAGIISGGRTVDAEALNLLHQFKSAAFEEDPADDLFVFPFAVMEGDQSARFDSAGGCVCALVATEGGAPGGVHEGAVPASIKGRVSHAWKNHGVF